MSVPSAAQSSQFWLGSHVKLCRTEDYIVLLDIRRNRYMGTPVADMASVAHLIENWPWPDLRSPPLRNSTCGDEESLLSQMIDCHMVTKEHPVGVPLALASVDPPTQSLIDGYSAKEVTLAPKDMARVLIACLVAYGLIHWSSFELIVDRARRRHSRAELWPSQADVGGPAWLENARTLVTKFGRLRPLLYTGTNACLFNSLALWDFMCRYRMYPSIVFGVRTSPFGAHCWLQARDVVLSDTAEYVGSYTPILVL